MMKLLAGAAIALGGLLSPGIALAQGGNLAAPPAENLELRIVGNGPALSATTFELLTGKYYRLTLKSDGAAEFMFSSPDLLANSNLRLVVVNDIEIHLQSLIFRGIEFDAGGEASFTFVVIRPGEYEFTVGDAKGTFVVK